MNIKNDQIDRLKCAVDLLASKVTTRSEKATLKQAQMTLAELEVERSKLNKRSSNFINNKRKQDPLYARSAEYKKIRLEKAKRIVELYGKEN